MRSQLIVEMAAAGSGVATALVVIWPMIERDRLTQRMRTWQWSALGSRAPPT